MTLADGKEADGRELLGKVDGEGAVGEGRPVGGPTGGPVGDEVPAEGSGWGGSPAGCAPVVDPNAGEPGSAPEPGAGPRPAVAFGTVSVIVFRPGADPGPGAGPAPC